MPWLLGGATLALLATVLPSRYLGAAARALAEAAETDLKRLNADILAKELEKPERP